jgi:hypothetical protein
MSNEPNPTLTDDSKAGASPTTSDFPPGVLSLVYNLVFTPDVQSRFHADSNAVMTQFQLTADERKVFSACGDVGQPDDKFIEQVLALAVPQVSGVYFKAW